MNLQPLPDLSKSRVLVPATPEESQSGVAGPSHDRGEAGVVDGWRVMDEQMEDGEGSGENDRGEISEESPIRDVEDQLIEDSPIEEWNL